jgi:hypothetical protein
MEETILGGDEEGKPIPAIGELRSNTSLAWKKRRKKPQRHEDTN